MRAAWEFGGDIEQETITVEPHSHLHHKKRLKKTVSCFRKDQRMGDGGAGASTPGRLPFGSGGMIASPFAMTPSSATAPSGWRTPGTVGSMFASPGLPASHLLSNVTPVSQMLNKPKKPAGSEGRYIVYYDEDDVEIFRKAKGPGRLPRGAFVDRDGNYGVKVPFFPCHWSLSAVYLLR